MSEITGCTKKINPEHNASHFKYGYNNEELSKYLSTNSMKKISRERSNDHFKESMVPSDSTASYLGSPNINCLLSDKVINGGTADRPTI